MIFSRTFVWKIYHSKNNSERHYHKCTLGLYVKWPLFLWEFNKVWNFFSPIFEKLLNIIFHKNPFSWSLVVACGWTKWRITNTTKLIFAFRNFVNAPKNINIIRQCVSLGNILESSLEFVLFKQPVTHDKERKSEGKHSRFHSEKPLSWPRFCKVICWFQTNWSKLTPPHFDLHFFTFWAKLSPVWSNPSWKCVGPVELGDVSEIPHTRRWASWSDRIIPGGSLCIYNFVNILYEHSAITRRCLCLNCTKRRAQSVRQKCAPRFWLATFFSSSQLSKFLTGP